MKVNVMARAMSWMIGGGLIGTVIAVCIVLVVPMGPIASELLGALCALAGVAFGGGWATQNARD